MGQVFRAVAVGAGGVERPACVKLLQSGMVGSPELRRRFEDEARLSFLLTHANIVTVYDAGALDDVSYIAMELVEGCDLGQLLQAALERHRATVPVGHALFAAREAAKGLDYAHRRTDGAGQPLGVVHRDVSPANILVSWEGEVKVADFGVARWSAGARMTQGQTLIGKCAYMSPEQARGEPVDRRSDLFSLGVVLYELLTGVNPFRGPMTTDAEAIARIRAGRFDAPSAVSSAIVPELEALVLRAMAPAPDERWASCGELAEAIERLAAHQGVVLSASAFAGYVRELSPPGALRPLGEPAAGLPLPATAPTVDVVNPGPQSTAAPATWPAPPQRTEASLADGDEDDVPRSSGGRWRLLALGALVGVGLLGGGLRLARPPRTVTQGPPSRPSPAPPLSPPPRLGAPAATLTSAPPRDTRVEPSSTPGRRAGAIAAPTGWLSVNTTPWSEVRLDGRDLGATPILRRKVPAGDHTVRLTTSASGQHAERRILVRPGEHVRVVLELGAQPTTAEPPAP
jgi:serine/threonine protein kinase